MKLRNTAKPLSKNNRFSIKQSKSALFDMSKAYIYKPFKYDWAYAAWAQQQRMFWIPEEISMTEDRQDWIYNLTESERELLKQIFAFFTQADIAVHDCYLEYFFPIFRPIEIKFFLNAFSNMETIHTAAYSYLIETLSMPDTTYSIFLEYKEMIDKWEFCMAGHQSDDLRTIALLLANVSIITEGILLFSSFAILASFAKVNKMKGMCQIIAWSIRDETLHNQTMTTLFNTMIDEHPFLWTEELQTAILERCKQAIVIEDKFIDLAFSYSIETHINPQEIKTYIRYLADSRLIAARLPAIYNIKYEEVSPWIFEMLYLKEHTNFFEVRPTDYSMGTLIDDTQDIESDEIFQEAVELMKYQKQQMLIT